MPSLRGLECDGGREGTRTPVRNGIIHTFYKRRLLMAINQGRRLSRLHQSVMVRADTIVCPIVSPQVTGVPWGVAFTA